MADTGTEAAAQRVALGRKAQRLIAGSGSAGERRALAFARAIGGKPARIGFGEIAGAPDWLALDRVRQRDLARRVGLVSMAASIAGSIDGEWLTTLARTAGDAALDHAVAQAEAGEACRMAPVEASGLEPRGFALMKATLPQALQPLADWAEADGGLRANRQQAEICLRLAQGAAA